MYDRKKIRSAQNVTDVSFFCSAYEYSLLFYKVYHEEGECRQLEFWLEKEQTLETYSA